MLLASRSLILRRRVKIDVGVVREVRKLRKKEEMGDAVKNFDRIFLGVWRVEGQSVGFERRGILDSFQHGGNPRAVRHGDAKTCAISEGNLSMMLGESGIPD